MAEFMGVMARIMAIVSVITLLATTVSRLYRYRWVCFACAVFYLTTGLAYVTSSSHNIDDLNAQFFGLVFLLGGTIELFYSVAKPDYEPGNGQDEENTE